MDFRRLRKINVHARRVPVNTVPLSCAWPLFGVPEALQESAEDDGAPQCHKGLSAVVVLATFSDFVDLCLGKAFVRDWVVVG